MRTSMTITDERFLWLGVILALTLAYLSIAQVAA